MENITGNEIDCSSEETEVFIIVTNLIKQMQTTCIMALVVVHVALERYYSRHESRFTEPNPYQEQIDHINRLVRRSDTTCVEQLRMDRNCFMRLCILVHTVRGLSHSSGLVVPPLGYQAKQRDACVPLSSFGRMTCVSEDTGYLSRANVYLLMIYWRHFHSF
ncbi:hypothetical protein Vadar_023605 [Vaccinium darrowii]|uniref:Uncharacterized protein n=1 Tax=Vaccinium darrowii TaxID=229202 RepID=A0ACB7Y8I9_9ERIC|nr:hypothetical protein Vadar_023605 [Vaccinium darrowii]